VINTRQIHWLRSIKLFLDINFHSRHKTDWSSISLLHLLKLLLLWINACVCFSLSFDGMKFKYSNKYLLSNKIGDSNIMAKNTPIMYESNKLCENIKVYNEKKQKLKIL
jgi:hypothetical protein